MHWTPRGHVFPAPHLPQWAESQFYAPELHWLAGLGRYAVYYAANTGPDKVSPDSTETSYMILSSNFHTASRAANMRWAWLWLNLKIPLESIRWSQLESIGQ